MEGSRDPTPIRGVILELQRFPVAIAAGKHPYPFRTRQLSPPAPMVLGGRPPGRVGRRRDISNEQPRSDWTGAVPRPAYVACAPWPAPTSPTTRALRAAEEQAEGAMMQPAAPVGRRQSGRGARLRAGPRGRRGHHAGGRRAELPEIEGGRADATPPVATGERALADRGTRAVVRHRRTGAPVRRTPHVPTAPRGGATVLPELPAHGPGRRSG